jgi:chromate reductase, NAD(P)H dehydrogenase (quinone)
VPHIIGISGSLRKGSYNTALLHAAARCAPEGTQITPATLHGIPLYDGDLEDAEGVPAAVTALQDAIAAADGLILVTPEYNGTIPGVLKNAMDWLTRPAGAADRVFQGKPTALIGATPGGFGTVLSQNHWLPVLRALGVRPYFEGRLLVSRAHTVFDAEGALTDPKVEEQLRDFLRGFGDAIGTAGR